MRLKGLIIQACKAPRPPYISPDQSDFLADAQVFRWFLDMFYNLFGAAKMWENTDRTRWEWLWKTYRCSKGDCNYYLEEEMADGTHNASDICGHSEIYGGGCVAWYDSSWNASVVCIKTRPTFVEEEMVLFRRNKSMAQS